jgi:hypothetical protein
LPPFYFTNPFIIFFSNKTRTHNFWQSLSKKTSANNVNTHLATRSIQITFTVT